MFNLIDAPVFKYGISSNKLFDFLAAARPVIFCCSSSNNPVEEAGAGLTVPPGDPVALADAVRALRDMPVEKRNSMGRAGRSFVESCHAYDVLAAMLAGVLDRPSGTNNDEVEVSN